MGISEPGETERLLKRVSGLLAKVIKARDSYGRLRVETFRQANVLLVGEMAGIRKELEGTENTAKLARVIELGMRVQNLITEVSRDEH